MDLHAYGNLIMWVAIVIVVVVVNYFSFKSQQSRHRLMETLAEKGQTIPPDFMIAGRGYHRVHSPIQSGLFLMCIGIALAVFFWAMNGGGNLFEAHGHMPNWLPAVGIFPFMVGLARFLGGLFDRRSDK
ncbi:MAG: hypothetical protein JO261_01445 [Alphaproteobacteria bacterium]|nr:hypothetical protein [Alphaproteobacteria bacterium]MBV9692341.1 hypothetical protein [Alphaproteobacteria bacterium]